MAKAKKVTNPGCHATGAIALLRPLVDAGILPKETPVSITSVSGYSGGGKSMIEAYETGKAPAFELYGLTLEHKHIPEIHLYSGLATRPIFVPSVGNFRQGMLVSVPLHLDALPAKPTLADLRAAFDKRYGGRTYFRFSPRPTARGSSQRPSTAPTTSRSTSWDPRRAARPCWSPSSTISARAPRARRCRT